MIFWIIVIITTLLYMCSVVFRLIIHNPTNILKYIFLDCRSWFRYRYIPKNLLLMFMLDFSDKVKLYLLFMMSLNFIILIMIEKYMMIVLIAGLHKKFLFYPTFT